MSEERRVVTILFADVAGSTALGETLDPEDVRALMGRYYEAAQRVVADHGGTLEKFIGDAVMAVFGLPQAHGDDAERATAAAVALREAVRGDGDLGGLELRFGLATGEVVASRDVARGQFLVTGDAVNVAARLQQAAETWEILATERTAFDAGARFDFGATRELPVKGRAEPVRVRGLVGAAAGRPARPVVGFVGREDELDQLRITARRCFREGTPAVVSIVAAAGTGKTRLVEEFCATVLPDLAPAARVETAQCLPYGRQMTYWPLRSVLFSLAGIEESAQPSEIVAALERWLGSRRDAELLAATVGAESAESADPTELFGAWRAAFAKAASAAPLVLVFEDLHWSSDSLLDLVEFVMDPREPVPVLTVAIARPELIDRRPTWGGGRRNFLSLYLDPLPESEIVAVVRPLLEGASDDLVRDVVRRSEGNPFFAGELARAALEAGGETLPDTVQATVLARLDLLPEQQRRLLQVASVFGRSFRPEGVEALAPELGAVDAHLSALRERDLLRRQDDEHHAFRHILIRDVAYSTLPRAERARLHTAAGDWFAERAAGREDAVAEIVALHYREAAGSRTAPEEVRRKAVRWLRQAAEAALSAAATREGVEHLRAAIDLAQPGDEAAELWARLGEATMILPGSGDAFRRARRHAVSPRMRMLAVDGLLLTGMRWVFSSQLTPDELEEATAEGERLIAELGDEELEGRFRAALAFKPHWAGNRGLSLSPPEVDAARDQGRRALEVAERLDLPDLASVALDGLSAVEMGRGDWARARELARRRQAIADRLSGQEKMDADHMVTWASMALGEPGTALQQTEASAAKLRPGQAPEWRLSTMIWKLRAVLVLGRWEEAMQTATLTLAQLRQLAGLSPPWIAMSLPLAMEAARGRGDLGLAGEIAEAIRSAMPPAPHTRQRAVLALTDDDPARAVAELTPEDLVMAQLPTGDVLAAAGDAGVWRPGRPDWPLDPADVAVVPVRVQIHRALGLSRGDRDHLRAALDLARASSDVPATARLCVELGRSAGDAALVDEGGRLLSGMGDQRQMERYNLTPA